MVIGLDTFAAAFAGHEDCYVLIGGTACYLNLLDVDLPFRATKDLDIVLVTESMSEVFVRSLWSFLDAGCYAELLQDKSDRRSYRFSKPSAPDYPAMLELFSRQPDALSIFPEQHVGPMLVDGITTSLSVILLDDEYYRLIRQSTSLRRGCTVAAPATIILLKARAWMDLSRRRDAGEAIDTHDIRKHRNDVLRLFPLLSEAQRVPIPPSVLGDFTAFCDASLLDPPIPRDFGVHRSFAEIIAILRGIFVEG